ncbi:InlB B-repeat-containing protein [Lachnospiraceae bacterium OttesenSCG-928-E19]|nr:InlB B-repeat-containing protein [Lachnospiraceae bacterium OttesenSCG-928-E19]
MKIFPSFFSIVFTLCVLGVLNPSKALDCNSSMGAVYCDPQASGLVLTGGSRTYSEVSTAVPKPCCLLNCLPNAKHNGLVCTCDSNYYNNSGNCTLCASLGSGDTAGMWPNSTYPSTGAATNCSGTCSDIQITGGVRESSGTVTYPTPCTYTVKCNAGYHVNGDTCTACPVDTYKSGPADNATLCTYCNTADGYTTRGATGQTSMAACKKTCPVADVTNGTWRPDSDIISQTSPATDCTYTNDANLTCKPGYEKTGSGASATCTGETYTLKFNENHPSASGTQPDITTCKFGEPCSWTNNFENPGYKQDGWATTEDGPTTINETSYTQTGTYSATVTLYAKWTECGNNGKDHATGWTPRMCVITSCSTGYGVTGTGTSTACTGQNYTINFNAGGGNTGSLTSHTCRFGSNCTWTNTVTRNGYSLTGWAVSPSGAGTVGGTLPNSGSYTPTTYHSSVTLTAQWTECTNAGKEHAKTWQDRVCIITSCNAGYDLNNPGTTNSSCGVKTYTITFKPDGTDVVGTMDIIYCTWGVPCTIPANKFQRPKYAFDGWALTAGGTKITLTDSKYTPIIYPSSGNVDFYARWTICNNDGAQYVNEWNPNCTILSCQPGYYWHNKGKLNSYGNTTACGSCDDNSEAGKYCPGLNCNGTQCNCEPGFYCPGYGIAEDCGSQEYLADAVYIGRCKCPIGTTSSETSSEVRDCYIQGGSTGTRFCDDDGCFYLNADIPYAASN